MRTPSAFRYGTSFEIGQLGADQGLILPGGYELPDLPGAPEQPTQPAPQLPTLPSQQQKKKTDWLPIAIVAAGAIVALALTMKR